MGDSPARAAHADPDTGFRRGVRHARHRAGQSRGRGPPARVRVLLPENHVSRLKNRSGPTVGVVNRLGTTYRGSLSDIVGRAPAPSEDRWQGLLSHVLVGAVNRWNGRAAHAGIIRWDASLERR